MVGRSDCRAYRLNQSPAVKPMEKEPQADRKYVRSLEQFKYSLFVSCVCFFPQQASKWQLNYCSWNYLLSVCLHLIIRSTFVCLAYCLGPDTCNRVCMCSIQTFCFAFCFFSFESVKQSLERRMGRVESQKIRERTLIIPSQTAGTFVSLPSEI